MHFMISNRILCIEPTREILLWCENNLVLRNPEYDKKSRMGLWIGETPELLYFYTKEGRNVEVPFGCLSDLAYWIRTSTYQFDFVNAPVQFMRKTGIELYGYQKEASNMLRMARNGVLLSPTASGKTITALSLIGDIGQRALWLCHSKELLEQAVSAYELLYQVSPGDIGVIKEGRVEIGAKMTFSLVQTLAKHIHDVSPNTFGCVIADEAQFCIKSLSAAAMFSKCVEHFKAQYKYTVTATLHRADGQEARIEMLFGHVVHEVPRSEVADKIMRPTALPLCADTPESFEYLNTDGTMNYTKLVGYLAENRPRNKMIANVAATALQDGRSVLILCDRVNQAVSIKEYLWWVARAEVLDGSTPKPRRGKTIEEMRSGACRCLIATTKLAGTGLDIPRLDCLIMASVQKDLTIVTQSIGRISRAMPGKPPPVCYDVVDVNIGYCLSAHKKRIGHYRKAECLITSP